MISFIKRHTRAWTAEATTRHKSVQSQPRNRYGRTAACPDRWKGTVH